MFGLWIVGWALDGVRSFFGFLLWGLRFGMAGNASWVLSKAGLYGPGGP